MRHTGLVLLLVTLLTPVRASALQAEDLVAIAAMPLAVAAVSEITDVPTSELVNLVATLNQAQVPAPQFIEVVRYAPVALVDTSEPFVPYITSQVESGVRGEELAIVAEERIERYDGADTIDVVHAPRAVVVDDDFYPDVVVTRFNIVRYDPLALVAMPLAVAAASEITGVPPLELASLVRLLNQGSVPPQQFIEIVRFSPGALVDRDPQLVTYVTTQLSEGRRGAVLAEAIEDRWDVPSSHPHGGPPGQLKKELGLQTGAEVVHGTHPGQGKARVASRKAERRTERVASSRGHGGGGGKSRKAERVAKAERQHVKRLPRAERAPRVEHVPHVDHTPKMKQDRVAAPKASSHGNAHGGGGGGGKSRSGNGKGKGKG